MIHEPLVIERTFDVPVSTVWKAISDKDEMKGWYFDLKEFKPEIGFEFEFSAGRKDQQYLHQCKITEAIPQQKLTYSWQYAGYEGNSFVTFELSEEGRLTRLKLTHRGLETFPADNPDLAKDRFAEGWNYIIGQSLPAYLEKSHA